MWDSHVRKLLSIIFIKVRILKHILHIHICRFCTLEFENKEAAIGAFRKIMKSHKEELSTIQYLGKRRTQSESASAPAQDHSEDDSSDEQEDSEEETSNAEEQCSEESTPTKNQPCAW